MKRSDIFKELSTCQGHYNNHNLVSNDIEINFSHSKIPEEAFKKFDHLTKSLQIIDIFNSFFSDNNHNFTEDRSVNHHQLRSQTATPYTHEMNRLIDFINSDSLSHITDVVQIGIGGSHLGPQTLYDCLEAQLINENQYPHLKGHFISNIDPIEFKYYTSKLNPKTTLFLIASKSGSTLEVNSNFKLLKQWWNTHNLPDAQLKDHCIALTSKHSTLDDSALFFKRFYIDESIGGRFSTTSVIGMCIIGLCFGSNIISEILAGALAMDINAKLPNISENLALVSSWEHIWQRNIKNYPLRAVVAYSYALRSFPAFIQQLTCESNGKSVDKNNERLSYKTAPMIIAGIGTNAQHSFFQLIHQGTDTIPIEFIGIKQSNLAAKTDLEKNAHNLLLANLNAQIKALDEGEYSANNHFLFKGNKPSLSITLKSLTPHSLGQLIAYYENKTMFEGLIWNINSFDQIGVQLAKKLIKEIT
tara:strand:+ start:573 stop:1991 length:1419 start_codon:yes stop_codon:yes gene_type:complete